MPDKITNSYLHSLQAIYCGIGDRGICVDYARIQRAKKKVRSLIDEQLLIPSSQWGMKVFIGKDSVEKKELNCVNLNATSGERALLGAMKTLGYHVPKITKKDEDGDYKQAFSTGELALQKMLTENQFNHPGGDPAIRAILKVRELGKILSSYLNARFLLRAGASEKEEAIYLFLASYNVGGTVTGRRSSRKHTFGFGNNAQNFPKHSSIAGLFRECLVPRRGNIFLNVDQCQAEEWPVSALSQNHNALRELRNGEDRHSKLATAVFGRFIAAKDSPQWDKKTMSMERYLGKKIKHARNYGMKATRMSESLAQEGFSIPKATCEILLAKAASVDPTVDSVFHQYVQDELSRVRMLRTPFGRERYFLGARPNADNSTLFNEAYSYIPQSTVGDLTGFAVFDLETLYPQEERFIVQESHDSICQDVPEDIPTLVRTLDRVRRAFDRKIKFSNGIEIQIPIEADLGYDFNTTVEFKDLSEAGLKRALEELKEKREEKRKKDSQEAA
jgi:DNA polymerase I-like protein with 3'-5' exonuclease and polymerase domains